MINGIFLQAFGFTGGGFGDVLSQLNQLGFFSYVLPFLLIFALVFGILTRTNVFKEKPINAMIALAVAFMSLQFGFVSIFFQNIFPNLGIALGVIVAVLILLGMFTDTNQTWILLIIGIMILIVVLWNSFNFTSTPLGFWIMSNPLSTLIIIVLLIVIITAFVPSQKRRYDNIISRSIGGENYNPQSYQ